MASINSVAGQEANAAKTIDSMKPRTLYEMLHYRAELTPDVPLWCYPSAGTTYTTYTAGQVETFVKHAARIYAGQIGRRTDSKEPQKTVGLLALADLDYVVSFFALQSLGHTVAALSPRLSLEAHQHLLNKLDIHNLVYGSTMAKMAQDLEVAQESLNIHSVRGQVDYMLPAGKDTEGILGSPELDMDAEGENIAVIIHSSGSTGMPKPIKLAHKTLVTSASKHTDQKAFTCVPFFHAFGLNGLIRSVYSGQTFYMYNASTPLTAQALIETIKSQEFEIFFCVPYALKLLAETEEGVEVLKKPKLIWFAGSACPDDLGNTLTEQGIILVSDYGCSECGPLMNTIRPTGDDAWNYLRPLPHCKPFMAFEDRGENQFELVCHEGMPWKVATNREDGAYTTGDVFEKHPTIADAWRFAARRDDTLVLSNGEKANPGKPEAMARQHLFVTEAVMFGAGQTELGMALIKSEAAQDLDEHVVIDEVWPTIKEAQKEMPEHARIVKEMIITLPYGTVYPRTDKGTIIRQQFYKKFANEIEEAYTEKVEDQLQLKSEEVGNFIRNEVLHAMELAMELDKESELNMDTDLFAFGIDSLKSTQLRRTLQTRLDLRGHKLPINVVYENPTIRQLAELVSNYMTGNIEAGTTGRDTFHGLIEEFGNFEFPEPRANEKVVVLTGATGSLGAHALAQVLKDEDVVKVVCFVRAESRAAAAERVDESLRQRRIYDSLTDDERSKIIALNANLSIPGLNISVNAYKQIATRVTCIIHAAWPVNFNMSLGSFRSDIVGTKNLLELCLSPLRRTRPSFAFCSSISVSMNMEEHIPIPESVPEDLSPAMPMGYAHSKLVAEHLCLRAAAQTGLKAYVIRIGQICGDTGYGIWNANEAIPMMIRTADTIGALPDFEEMHKWIPVDLVAKTILDIAMTQAAPPGMVFNVVSRDIFTWKSDVLPKLAAAGMEFDTVPVADWLQRLRDGEQDGNKNPPIKLLGYYESIYGSADAHGRGEHRHWETDNTAQYSSTFARGWKVSQDNINKTLDYLYNSCWTSVNKPLKPVPTTGTDDGTISQKEIDQMRKEIYGESKVEKVSTNDTAEYDSAATTPINSQRTSGTKLNIDAAPQPTVLSWEGTRFELRGQ